MKNHQGELTPQSKLLGRNAALALLELPLKDVHFTWLKSKWEGELKWNSRKAFKGYALSRCEPRRLSRRQCIDAGVPYYLKPNLGTAPGMQLTQMLPRKK